MRVFFYLLSFFSFLSVFVLLSTVVVARIYLNPIRGNKASVVVLSPRLIRLSVCSVTLLLRSGGSTGTDNKVREVRD